MTKDEIATIENLIARLREKNLGAKVYPDDVRVQGQRVEGLEVVSRNYVNTRILPALERLLPGPNRDPKLARELSKRSGAC